MELKPGDKLGAYEIVSAIGKGGMGEVWKARDPQIRRDVAIKVSAQQFTDRFEREVRSIGALNHPNICTLHHVGPNYPVMEFIEGPTLADRIAQGPIPLGEALGITKQIADALEAAHEKNIVHRDLKPANIKIRPDGSVKVLDFGLAKTGDTQEVTPDSPTMMLSTQMGTILGTAGYMSPEQARGKEVDKRADIWAFGVLLYELLTGERLFKGPTVTDTLAAVLTREPDYAKAPARARRLLRRCLEKDPKKRLRDIGDWAALIEEESVAPAKPAGRPVTWTVALGAALVALIALGLLYFRDTRTAVPAMHLTVPLPGNIAQVLFVALSPDGRTLALTVRDKDGSAGSVLAVRPLDSDQIRILPNTIQARTPFWSPDGRNIGFLNDNKLKVVSASGGPPQELCDKAGIAFGGTWNRGGVILISTPDLDSGQLLKVNASGGGCGPLPEDSSVLRMFPYFLPDGKHFLFLGAPRRVDKSAGNHTGVYIASLDEPNGKRLLPDNTKAIYAIAPDGRAFLIFRRDGALVGQAIDPDALALRGDVFKIAGDVGLDATPTAATMMASVAANGVLVYGTGRNTNTQLTWLDRAGKVLSIAGPTRDQEGVALSPDGRQIVVSREIGDPNLWLRDATRDDESRLTAPPLGGSTAVWSPAGRMLAFTGSNRNLYRKDISGGGKEELILTNANVKFASDWSRDGRFLLFTEVDPKTKGDIWVLPDPGGSPGAAKPYPFLHTDADESEAQLSPDGRWIAYVSDESGLPDVYVRPFPSGPGRWKAPGEASGELRWRSDGKELFYWTGGTAGRGRLMAVPVNAGTGASFAPGEPQPLFENLTNTWPIDLNLWTYSVAPDGQRFLVLVKPDVKEAIHVLSNWPQIVEGRK